MRGVSFQGGVTGCHHGQTDGVLRAFLGDRHIGHLDWSSFQGKTYVNMIEVDPAFRMQGIAKEMIQRLRKETEEPILVSGDVVTTEGQHLLKHLGNPADYALAQSFHDYIRAKYPGVLFLLMPKNDGTIELLRLEVPRGSRLRGIGTAILSELVAWADANQRTLTLQVAERDPKLGTTSRARLIKFYRRFGFVRNRGRHKRFDLSIYATMYREPIAQGM